MRVVLNFTGWSFNATLKWCSARKWGSDVAFKCRRFIPLVLDEVIELLWLFAALRDVAAWTLVHYEILYLLEFRQGNMFAFYKLTSRLSLGIFINNVP